MSHLRITITLVAQLALGAFTATQAQGVVPRVTAGWGTNLLTSPGSDLVSSPGRSGYFGAGLCVGGKVRFEPDITFTGNTYRTRMAYKVFVAALRTSVRADLVLGFAQMNGATLRVGPFVGSIQRTRSFLEQGDQNTFFAGFNTARLENEHAARKLEAGVVLGYAFPITNDRRFGLELQLRQHLIPLVQNDQRFALQFSPEQQVFASNTRPTVLSVGAYFRLKAEPAQKG